VGAEAVAHRGAEHPSDLRHLHALGNLRGDGDEGVGAATVGGGGLLGADAVGDVDDDPVEAGAGADELRGGPSQLAAAPVAELEGRVARGPEARGVGGVHRGHERVPAEARSQVGAHELADGGAHMADAVFVEVAHPRHVAERLGGAVGAAAIR
jgi:hypothetical protein